MQIEIEWLQSAVDDLARLQTFIGQHNPQAAQKAAITILEKIELLEAFPELGKPVLDLIEFEFRDLQISFGQSNYIIRYRIFNNILYVCHLRHGRENSFKSLLI